MSLGDDTDTTSAPRPDGVPPTDRRKIVLASICLAIPIVALLAVPTYAKEGPELFDFPFFYWWQFLWVFLCSGFTWAAYRLTLSARAKRPER